MVTYKHFKKESRSQQQKEETKNSQQKLETNMVQQTSWGEKLISDKYKN